MSTSELDGLEDFTVRTGRGVDKYLKKKLDRNKLPHQRIIRISDRSYLFLGGVVEAKNLPESISEHLTAIVISSSLLKNFFNLKEISSLGFAIQSEDENSYFIMGNKASEEAVLEYFPHGTRDGTLLVKVDF